MVRAFLPFLLLAAAAAAGDDLAAYLDRCERFGFTGTVLVVRKGAVVVQRGYGLADREQGVPNGPDTLFEIASATKPFTACAVMKLVEMGKVGLDDPIGKHLPGVPEDKRAITVADLLAHTSGMSRMSGGGRGPDLGAAVAAYLAAPLVREPGEAHEYWNGGYALLAGIVERAGGMDYTDFCRKHLFEPAGLRNTGFTGDDLEHQAIGYETGAAPRRAAEHPYGAYGWQYRGMGGLVTSAADLRRFLEAYDAGRILARETVTRMEAPRTPHYGLGWGMASTKRGTRRIGHGGDVRGFHCQIQRFPDEDALVIVLCNIDLPTWTVAWNLEALLFGEDPPYPMPPDVATVPDTELAALEGEYVLDETSAFTVAREAGGLRIGAAGLKACALLRGDAFAGAEPAVATARGLLDACVRGDAAPVAAAILDHSPDSWPGHLVGSIWPAHLERWGGLGYVRTLSAEASDRGAVTVLFELGHENGTAHLKVVLVGGRLSIFDLRAQRALPSTLVLPQGDGRFAGFAWMGPQPPPVRFQDGALVLGDDRAKRQG